MPIYNAKDKGREFGRNKDSRGLSKFITDNPGMTQPELDDLHSGYTEGVQQANANKTQNNNSNSPSSPFGQLFDKAKGKSNISNINSDEFANFTDILTTNPLQGGMMDEVLKQVQRESDLLTQINEKVGLTGTLSADFRENVEKTLPAALSLGYNFTDVVGLITRMGDQSGRFNLLSKETLQNSFAVSRAFVGSLENLADYFTEFEKIGQGAFDTLDAISRAGMASLSLGLNSKKTTDMLRQNIGKLNEYGFQNGVDGLNRMVQKSIEFRMNVGEAFKIADNVMDPEKAIALTANLQVLGGAIGDFNDPLKLMYMATNNVEGLQDALIDAAGSLATYNAQQGRFEITGVNLRRAKEMAQQLGVSYEELAKGAIAAQERTVVNSQLLAKGLNVSKEDKEFITNMSQMKNGQMTITIPKDIAKNLNLSSEIAIKDLSQSQIEQLKAVRKELENKTPEQIARGQFTSIQNIEYMLQAITRTIVTDITKMTIGEGGVADIKRLFEEKFTAPTKAMYATAESRSPEFKAYINDIFAKVSGPLIALTGSAKTSFEQGSNELIEKFITKSANATPEQIQKNYMQILDQLGQWFRTVNDGRNMQGVIQNRLTIVDQSGNGNAYIHGPTYTPNRKSK